jgi:hypothetical protein
VTKIAAAHLIGLIEPEDIANTIATVLHDLVEPLIGFGMALDCVCMLPFDLPHIFRRSVSLVPNSGKQVSKQLFRARCMVNRTLKKRNADHLSDPFRV